MSTLTIWNRHILPHGSMSSLGCSDISFLKIIDVGRLCLPDSFILLLWHYTELCIYLNQRLYFLRKLKRAGLDTNAFKSFYTCVVECVQTTFTVFYGSNPMAKKEALQRVVKSALRTTRCSLPPIRDSIFIRTWKIHSHCWSCTMIIPSFCSHLCVSCFFLSQAPWWTMRPLPHTKLLCESSEVLGHVCLCWKVLDSNGIILLQLLLFQKPTVVSSWIV